MSSHQAIGYNSLVDYITTGYWRDQGLPRFVLDPGRDHTIKVDTSELTAAGKVLAENAMEAWESVADITFKHVTPGRIQIRFDDNAAGANTRFFYDGNGATQAHVNITTDWLAYSGTITGSYSFQTYMHEIGHALGLGHPGDYNGNNPAWDGSGFNHADSWQLTLMSYFGQDENPFIDASRAAAVTPMLADILAVQGIHGVATGGATAGRTVYGVGSTLDNYLGDYQREGYVTGVPLPYAATFTIFDEGGIDTIDLSHHGKPQVIYLAPGGISDIIGQIGNMIIMPGTMIENYIAGFGADLITGNRVANQIDGGRGNDTIYGRAGADRLLGGDHDDRLRGGGGRDRLSGENGNDIMRGGGNADIFVFGKGVDVVLDFNNLDQLLFEDTLWAGRRDVSVAEIMDHASVTADGVVFDFGRFGSLTLTDWTQRADLADDVGLA